MFGTKKPKLDMLNNTTELSDYFDLPGFVHRSITVRDVYLIAARELDEYAAKLDVQFCSMVDAGYHHEIVATLRSRPDEFRKGVHQMISEDYEHQAVMFVINATVVWAQDILPSLTDEVASGSLQPRPLPDNVVPLVFH